MQKSNKFLFDMTENELKDYFYGYTLHKTTGDIERDTILNEVITLEHIYPLKNYNSPISILTKWDEELALYSIGGVETLNIYSNYIEKQDKNKSVRDSKKILYGG